MLEAAFRIDEPEGLAESIFSRFAGAGIEHGGDVVERAVGGDGDLVALVVGVRIAHRDGA